MTYDEQPSPTGSVYASAAATAPQRRSLRRKQALVGVAGLGALLAGGGFLAGQLMGAEQDTLPEPAALAPLTTAPTPVIDGTGVSAVPGTLRASHTTLAAQPARRSPSPTPRIDPSPAAGIPSSAGADGPPSPTAAGLQAAVARRVEVVDNGTVRVSSARADLTGRGDLRLAADLGRSVGNGVRCTNRIRFTDQEAVDARDSLLLCWRTSDRRSVVTMAVASRGTPDAGDSIEIIAREWAQLD